MTTTEVETALDAAVMLHLECAHHLVLVKTNTLLQELKNVSEEMSRDKSVRSALSREYVLLLMILSAETNYPFEAVQALLDECCTERVRHDDIALVLSEPEWAEVVTQDDTYPFGFRTLAERVRESAWFASRAQGFLPSDAAVH